MADATREEFEGLEENTEAPNTEAKQERIMMTWENEDGSAVEVSRAEYIRRLFKEKNMGRKEIAEEMDVDYRVVYSATVNMENEAEPATRGRSAQNPMIDVDAENNLVIEKDGVVYINGEVSNEAAPATTQKGRNEWIKEQVQAGTDRGALAKMLDISYGVVYNLTKEFGGTRSKHMITIENEDGTTSEVTRSDYIRMLAESGMEKSAIAKELDVEYPVVWQALKKDETGQDKYDRAVEKVEKFADQVAEEDQGQFNELLKALKAVVIPEPVAEEAAEEDAE